ncbi:MAG TPA: SDR family NAD(P)-dependent oxidoreductase [Streptosporangiaceae bacterium]|nr:SDR family NAD(P)-dependent oxidoreductase [Streptosporangiaceae bacterium]
MSGLANLTDGVLEASIVGSFSRIGFAARSGRLPEFRAPLPSMEGRTVLITGATSGIGLAAACELARLGAQVNFLARDRSRAETARRRIAAAAASAGHDRAGVWYDIADLEDLESVGAFAAKLCSRVPGLDVLIHNAGAIRDHLATTPDGIELTVAGQLVAPFVLTELLLDRLRSAAPARVITISSGGMYFKHLDIPALTETSPSGYSGAARYALVKRAQVTLNTQWAARTDPAQIAFHAVHPGWVRTPGLGLALPRFSRLMSPLLRTPAQGADSIVWLAAADRRQLGSGRFWHDRRPRATYRRPGPSSDPPGTGQALWDWTAELASRSGAVR